MKRDEYYFWLINLPIKIRQKMGKKLFKVRFNKDLPFLELTDHNKENKDSEICINEQ